MKQLRFLTPCLLGISLLLLMTISVFADAEEPAQIDLSHLSISVNGQEIQATNGDSDDVRLVSFDFAKDLEITHDDNTGIDVVYAPVVYFYVPRGTEKYTMKMGWEGTNPEALPSMTIKEILDATTYGVVKTDDIVIDNTYSQKYQSLETHFICDDEIQCARQQEMFAMYAQMLPDIFSIDNAAEFVELPVVSGRYILYDMGTGSGYAVAVIDIKYKEDEECIAAIDALPETITLNDLEAVKAARAKYDALAQYEGAQDNITNYAKLTAAEETIANLVKGEADPVKDTISSLPKASELTLNDKAAVEAARTAYEALSDEAKEYVDNITTLELAEATIAKLEAQAELAQAKDALNQALENAEPEEDIDKLTDQVKQAKADLKEANEELTVAKETVKIQKVVIKKLKAKAQKKKTTVSWKSAGQGYQYEVYKSTKMSKGFKKAVTTKKVKAVVKKLKSKKTYYVKVRGFKTVNGKKVYTQFSDAVSVKVK